MFVCVCAGSDQSHPRVSGARHRTRQAPHCSARFWRHHQQTRQKEQLQVSACVRVCVCVFMDAIVYVWVYACYSMPTTPIHIYVYNYMCMHTYKYEFLCAHSVVKSYCGHGIGALFHSSPSVPHYAKNKGIGILKPGMVRCMCMCKCMCKCMCMCVYTCVCVCVCVCIHVYVCMCKVCISACVCIYMRACVCIHACVQVCTCLHTM
jgi:hypothetical protein